jgi:hypothetical protein
MGLDAERTQVRVIAEERVRELIRTRGIDPMRDHDAIRDAIEQTVADAVGEALASGEALRIDPVQLALEVQHAVAGFGPLQRFFDDPTVEGILLGGQFPAWNGSPVGRVVRLNADGTQDTAFTTNSGTGADYGVESTAVQGDGGVLLGGSFSTWNGSPVGKIVRLVDSVG